MDEEVKCIISYYIKISKTSGFCQFEEIRFQHLEGARNMNIDFKCDALCWQVSV